MGLSSLVVVAVGLVAVGAGLLMLMLCGPMDASRTSMIGRAHAIVTETLPALIMSVLRRILGERAARAVTDAAVWTFMRPNPLLQMFYMALVAGALGVFSVSMWPHIIAAKYVSAVHIITVPIIIVLLLVLYAAACLADPGTVKRGNVSELVEAYPYDNVIYAPNVCETCKLAKPARSKHCSWCNKCVARSDHHCVWINGCVGANNHRFFLGWLIVMTTVCIYGVALTWQIVTGIVDEKKLFLLQVIDPVTRARSPVTLRHVISYVFMTEYFLSLLGIFLLLVGVVLVAFTGYQLYLAASGTTTNELFKWDYAHHRLKKGGTYTTPVNPSASGPIKDKGRTITKASELVNIYNRGPVANLIDTFFPPHHALYPPLYKRK